MKRTFSGNMAALAAAGGALSAAAQSEPGRKRPEQLIAGLRNTNEVESVAACEQAPEYGASAVRPLAFTMGDRDLEVARKAKRALQKIVRHAGRPGSATEASAVESKLLGVIDKTLLSTQVRRDLLWMLSEIGTARAVEPIAALLTDKDLREDARCVLTRLPAPEVVAALKNAFAAAPDDFKYPLAESLRARGEKVQGYASKKLVPTAQTTVTPAQPKAK